MTMHQERASPGLSSGARTLYVGVFLLSLACLAFEVTLTRVFALAQWYHFAFMVVSVALLGFGAGGSLLTVFPWLRYAGGEETIGYPSGTPKNHPALPRRRGHTPPLIPLSAAFALSIPASYLVTDYVPFDSYRIAWEPVQFAYLAVYFLALGVPFLFAGLLIGALLTAFPQWTSRIYAANLAGSAVGCLVAVAAFAPLGGAGTVMLCALLGWLAVGAFAWPGKQWRRWEARWDLRLAFISVLSVLLLFTADPPLLMEVRLSPYKDLSQALRFPETRLLWQRWNAFSRVDVLESPGLHSAPGLSMAYTKSPPPQLGIFTDGGNPSPLTVGGLEATGIEFTDWLPVSLPYALRPGARALILEPGGGLSVLVALRQGASLVIAVEHNPLVVQVVRRVFNEQSGGLYQDPRVRVVSEEGRSYVRRSEERFDVIHLALADSYRPVVSGAYSLSEDYRYTVEAVQDYLAHLEPEGLLVIHRWLQSPPSESLRAWAVVVTALGRERTPDPENRLVALRSLRTMLILVKNGPFTEQEIAAVHRFCAARQFDLVYYPGMPEEEANRFHRLPEPLYHRRFRELLSAAERDRFYRQYSYDVRPPTDDRPFFFHFFTWQQTPQVLRTLGKTWQPFGGSGYLVLVILLGLALLASAAFIILPLAARRSPPQPATRNTQHEGHEGNTKGTKHEGHEKRRGPVSSTLKVFTYFAALGLGYLFVELPLMQRFILFLGQPVYAFAAVLGGLLLFSGLGSLCSQKPVFSEKTGFLLRLLNLRGWLLVGAVLLYPFLLSPLFRLTLGWPLPLRLLVTVLTLAPLGFLMGQPFPRGLAWVEQFAPELIPWAWAVNGCASVIASILATMGAIAWGFSGVLLAGAGCYAVAAVIFVPSRSKQPVF